MDSITSDISTEEELLMTEAMTFLEEVTEELTDTDLVASTVELCVVDSSTTIERSSLLKLLAFCIILVLPMSLLTWKIHKRIWKPNIKQELLEALSAEWQIIPQGRRTFNRDYAKLNQIYSSG